MYRFTHLPAPSREGIIGNRIGQLEAEVLTHLIELEELGAMELDADEHAVVEDKHTVELDSLYRRIDALRAMLSVYGTGEAGVNHPEGSTHEHGH